MLCLINIFIYCIIQLYYIQLYFILLLFNSLGPHCPLCDMLLNLHSVPELNSHALVHRQVHLCNAFHPHEQRNSKNNCNQNKPVPINDTYDYLLQISFFFNSNSLFYNFMKATLSDEEFAHKGLGMFLIFLSEVERKMNVFIILNIIFNFIFY